MCMKTLSILLSAGLVLSPAGEVNEAASGLASRPTSAAGGSGDAGQATPAGNLEYWLGRSKTASTQSAPAGRDGSGAGPFDGVAALSRRGALPGVLELSDGTQIAGWLYTTVAKSWQVYEARTKRWRQIPFAAVLSITAVVVEEKMEPKWRWKAMGVPERVYTGREYPTRRYLWRFLLADGTNITGAVKGQPLWVRTGRVKSGPFVLHERDKGEIGQALADLSYVRKIVVSRRLMKAVIQAHRVDKPASQPGGRR